MEESISDIFIGCPEYTFLALDVSLEKDSEKCFPNLVLENTEKQCKKFIHSFIHSKIFILYYCVLDVVLEVGDKAANKTDQTSALMECTV